MMKKLLRRSLAALLIWALLVQLGGWILEVRHCGHAGCARATEDPVLGPAVMYMAMGCWVVVMAGLLAYQLWTRRR